MTTQVLLIQWSMYLVMPLNTYFNRKQYESLPFDMINNRLFIAWYFYLFTILAAWWHAITKIPRCHACCSPSLPENHQIGKSKPRLLMLRMLQPVDIGMSLEIIWGSMEKADGMMKRSKKDLENKMSWFILFLSLQNASCDWKGRQSHINTTTQMYRLLEHLI